jgi:3-hydroxyisobutyrate dehydrogenase-like beta-hydroxyacid dehydrogenase
MGERLGVAPETLYNVISTSTGRSYIFENLWNICDLVDHFGCSQNIHICILSRDLNGRIKSCTIWGKIGRAHVW